MKVVSIVAQLATVTANLFVLSIRRALGLSSIAAIVTKLGLVSRDLGPITSRCGPISRALIAVEGALVFRQFLLVVANLTRFALRLRLGLPLVLPIMTDLGAIMTELSGLVSHRL